MQFCSLASGSSGNCHYVGAKSMGVLVDAGVSARYITRALESIDVPKDQVKGVLVTHEHTDHIQGIRVLCKRLDIPVYGTKATLDAVEARLNKPLPTRVDILKDTPFQLGEFEITALSVAHDAVDPVGYILREAGHCMGIVTDLGHVPDTVMPHLEQCDLVLIETNHDVEMLKMGAYPFDLKRRILSDCGHLSNEAAARVIVKLVKNGRIKHVFLGHLSQDNNFPELAYETVKAALHREAFYIGEDIQVSLLHRNQCGPLYTLV